MRVPGRKTLHTGSLSRERDRILSGDLSARIVQTSDDASIGEADDGSLWILLHDPERRPRGRDPGIMIEAERISFEQNGLVRVLDRRLSQDTIQRLIADLTGRRSELVDTAHARSGIPAGDYAGIVVEPIDDHYRVHTEGPAARRFTHMQSLGTHRWLVQPGEESQLRRELVNQLMPYHHRLAWTLVRYAGQILIGIAALSLALSIWFPIASVLCLVSLGTWALVRWRRTSLIGWARRRWVQPMIDRTQY